MSDFISGVIPEGTRGSTPTPPAPSGLPLSDANESIASIDLPLPSLPPPSHGINPGLAHNLPVTHPTHSAHPTDLKPAAEATHSVSTGSYASLFYFMNGRQKYICILALLCSAAQGCVFPIYILIFGNMIDSFSVTVTDDELNSELNRILYILLYLGAALLAVSITASFLWNWLALQQNAYIKRVYFQKLLAQSAAWHDRMQTDKLSANFIDQVTTLTSIFNEQFNMITANFTMTIAGVVVCFIRGWQLAFLTFPFLPVIVVGYIFYLKYTEQGKAKETAVYGEAGAGVEEAFAFIKTVKSCNGEAHEIQRFARRIGDTERVAVKYGWITAFLWALVYNLTTSVYGFINFIGVAIMQNGWWNHNWDRAYTVGDVVTISIAMTAGTLFLAQIGPVFKAIGNAKVAVEAIKKIIRSTEDEVGGSYVPDDLRGEIRFENVSFAFPLKPNEPVIRNLTMTIQPGTKVAFVGPSGCGKSTLIGLLERFYDPTEGTIFLDGVDLREYDLKFLRRTFGLVNQQPMLFADTIKFNLLLGSEVTEENEAEIWKALEDAEARDFVERLPEKLEQYVGAMGGQLSGGQKQRLAIARTILRKPRILLFDEATSALDTKNEKEVQKTLDQAGRGRTCITIAHRLSTIIDSDKIFVFRNGMLIEEGTHDELVALPDGFYRKMVPRDLVRQQTDRQAIEAEESNKELTPESEVSPLLTTRGDSVKLQRQSSSKKTEVGGAAGQLEVIAEPEPGAETTSEKGEPKNKKKVDSFLGREKYLIPVGILLSVIVGAVAPVTGYFVGASSYYMTELQCFLDPALAATCSGTQEHSAHMVQVFSGLVVAISAAGWIIQWTQLGLFTAIGERFSTRLRVAYFRSLLFKDMAFFDDKDNLPGGLASRIGVQCKKVNQLVATYTGCIIQAISGLLISLLIGLIISWPVALISLAFAPLVFFSSWQLSQVKGNAKTEEDRRADGSALLSESMGNMNVVRSLNAQQELLQKMENYDQVYQKKAFKVAFYAAFWAGLGEFLFYISQGALFRVCAHFVSKGWIDRKGFFEASICCIFGIFAIGQTSQFIGNIDEAFAAEKIIESDLNVPALIEKDVLAEIGDGPKPLVKTQETLATQENRVVIGSGDQDGFLRPAIKGDIEFRDVHFRFPSRDQKILKGLNLKFECGKSHAVVGTSGAGKSTIMQLIMRFYDPQVGQILVDGVDIKLMDVQHLRAAFGVVRQEPLLFNGTIDYNVRYPDRPLTEGEVAQALDMANATEFVNNKKDGLSWQVGRKGERLSGGEKQRVAIARTISQQPKVYLFDEATSALDNQSEKVVQNAIERLVRASTSITVAHRISTIQDSDKIFVLDNGILAEQGTFDELMKAKGQFCELTKH